MRVRSLPAYRCCKVSLLYDEGTAPDTTPQKRTHTHTHKADHDARLAEEPQLEAAPLLGRCRPGAPELEGQRSLGSRIRRRSRGHTWRKTLRYPLESVSAKVFQIEGCRSCFGSAPMSKAGLGANIAADTACARNATALHTCCATSPRADVISAPAEACFRTRPTRLRPDTPNANAKLRWPRTVRPGGQPTTARDCAVWPRSDAAPSRRGVSSTRPSRSPHCWFASPMHLEACTNAEPIGPWRQWPA